MENSVFCLAMQRRYAARPGLFLPKRARRLALTAGFDSNADNRRLDGTQRGALRVLRALRAARRRLQRCALSALS